MTKFLFSTKFGIKKKISSPHCLSQNKYNPNLTLEVFSLGSSLKTLIMKKPLELSTFQRKALLRMKHMKTKGSIMHKNLVVSILIFLTGANVAPQKYKNTKTKNEEIFEVSIVEFF
jgi:hypothetical protein